MNIEAIRNKALTCHKGCRVGIQKQRGFILIVWSINNELHSELVSTSNDAVNSVELQDELSRATEALIH